MDSILRAALLDEIYKEKDHQQIHHAVFFTCQFDSQLKPFCITTNVKIKIITLIKLESSFLL